MKIKSLLNLLLICSISTAIFISCDKTTDDFVDVEEDVLVDEAHATGVIGDKGAGTLSHFGITDNSNVILTGTLSKAIGLVGGYITASKDIIDYLRIYARSNMYSTSLPPNICASALEVLKHMKESDVIDRLMANSSYLKNGLENLGYNILKSESALIPIIIGDEYILTSMSKDIFDMGIFVNYIFPPVVPPKLSRIRVGPMACHTKNDMDYFINAMKIVGKKYNLIK
ncbi:MAG: pyridoxal phosphate-dependent aminotransferase family protein [Rikenellaceae bacterium]